MVGILNHWMAVGYCCLGWQCLYFGCMLLQFVLLLQHLGTGLCPPHQGTLVKRHPHVDCTVRNPEGVECKENEVS